MTNKKNGYPKREEHPMQSSSRPLKRVSASVWSSGRGKFAGNCYGLLGLKVGEISELLKLIRAGLAYSSWDAFLRNTDLEKKDVLSLVDIKERTLSRRKEEGRLRPDESDRLMRAARIFAQAAELFEGDMESARRWLTSSQIALGGETPVEYASTEVGAREVEALIGRLEYGIPA
jgi:putative toxin-antitoxin system antitoxin component (TIGR02293 family)